MDFKKVNADITPEHIDQERVSCGAMKVNADITPEGIDQERVSCGAMKVNADITPEHIDQERVSCGAMKVNQMDKRKDERSVSLMQAHCCYYYFLSIFVSSLFAKYYSIVPKYINSSVTRVVYDNNS
jgi:hypothetical protein